MTEKKTTRRPPAKPKKPGRKAPTTKSTDAAPRSGADAKMAALRQIADWIIAGNSDFQIDEASAAVLGIPKKLAKELRRRAYEFIGELIEQDPDLRKSWHVAARQELYRRALSIHDYKTARDILRDLAQLEGLYPKLAAKTKAPAGDDQAENPFPEFPTVGDFPTVQ